MTLTIFSHTSSVGRRVWDFDGNDMWFDVDEEIRFRVQSVKFHPVPTRMDMQVCRSSQQR